MTDELTPGSITLKWVITSTTTFPRCFMCNELITHITGPNYVTFTPAYNRKGVSFHSDCFESLAEASMQFKEYFIDGPNDNEDTPIIH